VDWLWATGDECQNSGLVATEESGAKNLWERSQSPTSPAPAVVIVDQQPLSEASDQSASSLKIPKVSVRIVSREEMLVPLPVPSSAASIKLDMEGKENLAEFGSSIEGGAGL
jgi:hypothetical protein